MNSRQPLLSERDKPVVERYLAFAHEHFEAASGPGEGVSVAGADLVYQYRAIIRVLAHHVRGVRLPVGVCQKLCSQALSRWLRTGGVTVADYAKALEGVFAEYRRRHLSKFLLVYLFDGEEMPGAEQGNLHFLDVSFSTPTWRELGSNLEVDRWLQDAGLHVHDMDAIRRTRPLVAHARGRLPIEAFAAPDEAFAGYVALVNFALDLGRTHYQIRGCSAPVPPSPIHGTFDETGHFLFTRYAIFEGERRRPHGQADPKTRDWIACVMLEYARRPTSNSTARLWFDALLRYGGALHEASVDGELLMYWQAVEALTLFLPGEATAHEVARRMAVLLGDEFIVEENVQALGAARNAIVHFQRGDHVGHDYEFGSLRDSADALKLLVERGLRMLRHRGTELRTIRDLALFYGMGREHCSQLKARQRVAKYIERTRDQAKA